jgi:hypothetical protein
MLVRDYLARKRAVDSPRWALAGGAPEPLAVWCARGASSFAESLLNRANPGTYNLTVGVAPTWAAATGWSFATNKYLRTDITAKQGQDQTLLVRFANRSGSALAYMVGAQGDGAASYLYIGARSAYLTYANGAGNNVIPTLTAGVLAVAGAEAYRNGVAEGAALGDWGSAPQRPLVVGARDTGTVAGFFTGDVLYVAYWATAVNAATWLPAVMAAVALE